MKWIYIHFFNLSTPSVDKKIKSKEEKSRRNS